jgi:hypothetical protein
MPRALFLCRSRHACRISLFIFTRVQDRDSDIGSAGSNSGDGLGIIGINNEEYYPLLLYLYIYMPR